MLEKGVERKTKYKDFEDIHHIFHFMSFKLKNYRETKGIDASLKQSVDQDLYYKLEEVGKFVYLDKPLYKYRIHNVGISTGTNQLRALSWHYTTIIDACKRRG